MRTDFDLFGHPFHIPNPSIQKPLRAKRLLSEEQRAEKLARYLAKSPNQMLFEVMDILKGALLKGVALPDEFASDIANVPSAEETLSADDNLDSEEALAALVEIPYVGWGEAWVIDSNGHKWSREALVYLQVRVFWRSMEELVLQNNEQEKWSVLRWIFRPAIWKHYVYDKAIGRSHCIEIHERDEPFSFHNCCIAARMDGDLVREGVRRNIKADVVKAVEDVCTFD